MNVEFLLIIYFVSLSVDWIFQTSWQATNKSAWHQWWNYKTPALALLSHSLMYAALTTTITLYMMLKFYSITSFAEYWVMFFILFLSHTAIDSRIPVKWIMRLKGMTKYQVNDTDKFGFMHIGIDHRLHEIVLLCMAFYIK